MLLLASQTIVSVSKNANIWNFLMALLSYIFLMIDSVVYAIVNKLYVLFLAIAQFKIFDDRIMQNIINRAYIVVGVISLFIIAYALLSAIINPDTSGKNDKGFSKIVRNFIIAVIGIAMVPTIFNWFYYFQKIVLCNNTIPRLLLKSDTGTSDDDSTASDIEKATSNIDYAEIGPEFSTYLFQSFFFPSSINTGDKDINIDEAIESIKILYKNQNNGAEPSDEMIQNWQERLQKLKEQSGSDADIEDAAKTVYVSKGADNWVSRALGWASTMSAGSGLGAIPSVIFGGGSRLAAWLGALLDSDKYTLNDAYESAKAGNSFWDSFRLFILGDSVGDNNSVANGGVTYLFIFSTIAGGYCAYVLLNMCIDIALRAVKLGYLEIIAPFTVMTVVLPGKDSVFKTWKDKTISCALEVFARVFIMSFTILIVRTVPFILKPSSVFCGTKIGLFTLLLLRALVYCGILTFAKKAPKFFSEVTGIKSDGFKLGIMDKLKESGVLQGLGAVGGGITAGVRNMAPGVAKGFATGGLGGAVMGGIKSLPSGLAGAASGTRRGWNKAKDAKKWSDVRTAAGDAADEAMEAKLKRQDYKDAHGGTTQGAINGHIQDAWAKVKDYPNSHRANYAHEKAKQEEISKITSAEKAIDDKYVSIKDKNKDIILYNGKTISAWEQEEETAKNYLAGLAQKKAELVSSGASKAAIDDIDKKIDAAQNQVIKARSDARNANRETTKTMHTDISKLQIKTFDSNGNEKIDNFAMKAEDKAIIDQLYTNYNSMLRSHIDAISGDKVLYEKAQNILADVSKISDEDAQKARFKQLVENQVDEKGEKYDFIDKVKVEAARVTEKMNQEGEAARKQQESKK